MSLEDARARRVGAAEGSGFGFLAAGAILGMAWIGSVFGAPVPLTEGHYAGAFLLVGSGIVVGAVARARIDH